MARAMSAVTFPLHYKLWEIPENFRSTPLKVLKSAKEVLKNPTTMMLHINYFVYNQRTRIRWKYIFSGFLKFFLFLTDFIFLDNYDENDILKQFMIFWRRNYEIWKPSIWKNIQSEPSNHEFFMALKFYFKRSKSWNSLCMNMNQKYNFRD